MPSLVAIPAPDHFGYVVLHGEGWGDQPVRIRMDGAAVAELSAVTGTAAGDTVRPAGGVFTVQAPAPSARSASVSVEVEETAQPGRRASAELIAAPPSIGARPAAPSERRSRELAAQQARQQGAPPRVKILQALREAEAALGTMPQPMSRPDGSPGNWQSVGPATIWNGQTLATFGGGSRGGETAPASGRVTAIAIDPLDPDNTLYAGTAQGGVWKSTDGGATWAPKSDFEASLAIGALAAVKMTANGKTVTRLYAGTGEANWTFNSYYGAGVLRSDDAGETWTLCGQNLLQGDHVAAIAVDPKNVDTVFVATRLALYGSIDAGANWTAGFVVQPQPKQFLPITDVLAERDGTNKLRLLVAVAGGAIAIGIAGNEGFTWSYATVPSMTGGFRVAFGRAPSQPATIYAAVGMPPPGPAPLVAFLKSTDNGVNWTQVTAPVGVPPDNLVDATYYNLAVAVDPNKPNTVLFANIRLWRSEDAGQTWSDVSLGTSPTANVSLHGDQHAIAFHPTAAGRLYVGNDGGVYRSNDGCANWISCNKGLQITQFNALSSAAPAAMIAGAQDNGVQGYFGDPAFTLLVIGDGGAVEAPAAWPPATPQRWYAAQAAGNYRGVSWSDTPAIPKLWNPPQDAGLPPLNDPSDTYAHFPPFVNTPWGLVYATSRLWLQPAPGQPWQSIIGKLAQATGATITTLHFTSVKIDPLNTEYSLAVGTSDGLFFRVTPPSSNNAAWTPQQYWGLSGAPVKQVSSTFWPGEGLRFVAVTGGFSGPHVWTTEQGITFTPATSPLLLETNPANCVHAETGTIFVGCDVGIFQSSNWGENWQRVDAGLPNVAVMDMEVGATTRVATYGRGIWEVSTGTPGAPVNVGLRHSDYDNGNLRLPMLGPSFPPILRPPLPVRGCPELESGYLMSPDLRIDTPDPSGKYQTPGTAIDFAQFATMTDCYPVAGRTMRVFLQVRNGGPNLATGVKARLYWCTKRNTPLDSLPAGFWGTFPDADPPAGNWSAIGPSKTVPPIQPGVPQVLEFDWAYPSTLPGDYTQTLLAVVSAPQDPDNPAGESSLSPSTFVRLRKWAAVKPVDICRTPTVSSMVPTEGPSRGGTEVTLTGTALAGARVVVAGAGGWAVAEVIGPLSPPAAIDTMAVVRMPPWPLGGVASVVLGTPGGVATSFTFSYT